MIDNIMEIVALEQELVAFLDKYGSKVSDEAAKYYNSSEDRLNMEWRKVGKDFIQRADEIFKRMSNNELLVSMSNIIEILQIVDVVSYFSEIEFEYEKEGIYADNYIKPYFQVLWHDAFYKDKTISDYYYQKIRIKVGIERAKRHLLTQMSNESIMFLAEKFSQGNPDYYQQFLKDDLET